MAFYNKLGGLLRQSISTSGNTLNAQSSAPSMLNAICCMSTKLFVGGMWVAVWKKYHKYCFLVNTLRQFAYLFLNLIGLSFGTDDLSLREAFTSFGDVVEGNLPTIPSLACFSFHLVFILRWWVFEWTTQWKSS